MRVSIEFPAKKKDAEEISDFFLPYLSNSLYTGQLERILLLGKHLVLKKVLVLKGFSDQGHTPS